MVKAKRMNMNLLKGNHGFLIDLEDNNLTWKKHNGIMNIIESFKVDVKQLKQIIKEFEEKQRGLIKNE